MSSLFGRDLITSRASLLQDNSQYLGRVNQIELQKQFILPTTTVVLSQDPPPGTQVPLGTQINLTLMSKGDIPVESLGAGQAVKKKWTRAGDVLQAVEVGGEALKAVLEKQVDYEKLDQGDRQVVDGFLRQQLGDVGGADLPGAYADIGFIYGL